MLESILAISVGIGLAAACGFRVFVPTLLMGIATRAGWITPDEGFEWIGSWPAIIVCAVATICEVLAYYVPWVDNLLDTISIPAAAIAGTIVSAAFISEFDPTMNWALAAIAGGGSAALIKVGMTAIRMGSSAVTGGFGNFLVSTFEWVSALVLALVAILLPLLALAIALLLVAVSIHFGLKLRQRIQQRRMEKLAASKALGKL